MTDDDQKSLSQDDEPAATKAPSELSYNSNTADTLNLDFLDVSDESRYQLISKLCWMRFMNVTYYSTDRLVFTRYFIYISI